MLNLREVYKFVLAEAGKGILLAGERRVIRLELNTAEPCQIVTKTGDGETRFLATVTGRETIEFVAEGPVEIWPDSAGEVWWWCSELEQSSVLSEAPSFTTIAERQARNPELERIARAMQENAKRREAALMDEIRAMRGEVNNLRAEGKKRGKAVSGAAGAAGGRSDGAGSADPAPAKSGAAEPVGPDGGTADEQ